MGQGIGSDLKSFCRSEDEIGWSDWDNGLQYVDNRIVHERGALSHWLCYSFRLTFIVRCCIYSS